MVHRPFRLVEIFQVLTRYKLEPKRMQLVYPFKDREPNMVLIEALKGGNSRITVEKPLIVYEKPGVYTEEIRTRSVNPESGKNRNRNPVLYR